MFIAGTSRENINLPSTSGNQRLRYEDVYSDSDDDLRSGKKDIHGNSGETNYTVKEYATMNTCFSAGDIKDQIYIIVELLEQSTNKTKHKQNIYRYVAICQNEVDEDGEVEESFLRIVDSKSQTNQLFRPDENDGCVIKFEEIRCILKPPTKVFKGKRVYYSFPTKLDIFEKR